METGLPDVSLILFYFGLEPRTTMWLCDSSTSFLKLTFQLLWLHEVSDLGLELFLREWRNRCDVQGQAEWGTAPEGITHLRQKEAEKAHLL